MTVGILRVEMRIPESHSLKDKRSVLLRIKNMLRKKYNISVVEIEDKDKWQMSVLAVAHIGDNRTQVDRCLCNVVDYMSCFNNVEIMDYKMELI